MTIDMTFQRRMNIICRPIQTRAISVNETLTTIELTTLLSNSPALFLMRKFRAQKKYAERKKRFCCFFRMFKKTDQSGVALAITPPGIHQSTAIVFAVFYINKTSLFQDVIFFWMFWMYASTYVFPILAFLHQNLYLWRWSAFYPCFVRFTGQLF